MKCYKDNIKPVKRKLEKLIKELMEKILEEFNDGYPSTDLLDEIDYTLQLLLSFSLPLSFHKFEELKSFISKVISSLPHDRRAKMAESFKSRYSEME